MGLFSKLFGVGNSNSGGSAPSGGGGGGGGGRPTFTGGGKKVNVLVVGLDNSGKTTIIEFLKPNRVPNAEIAPTVGFNVEHFSKGGLQFTVFDMSGGVRYRNLWESYYKEVHAVIFVVDSADKLRLIVAKDELENMLNHVEFRPNVPILFFANKRDIQSALTPVEIATALNLQALKDRTWQIFPSNALKGEGLERGTDWLADQIKKQNR